MTVIEHVINLLKFLKEFGENRETLVNCTNELFGVLDYFIYTVFGISPRLSGGGTSSANMVSIGKCFVDKDDNEIWITIEIEKKNGKTIPRLVIHLE